MNDENQSFLKLLVDWGLGYVWFIILALWGGLVNYISKIKKSKTTFSTIEFIGDLAISGFSGLITAYICLEMEWSFYMTAALTAISGHMGARAIFLMENWVQSKFGQSGK